MICKQCGKDFIRNKQIKYCSIQCRSKGRELGIDISHPKTICPECNKEFRTTKAAFNNYDHQFCSRKCVHKYRTKGNTDLPSRRRTKFILLNERGKKCEVCGYNRHEEMLIVHHKLGVGTINTRENVILLCPTCHAEAHLELCRKNNKTFSFFGSSRILLK
jgi:hypothetical protein